MENNKKVSRSELGDVLYKVVFMGSSLSSEEQVESLKSVIASNVEPYASFASMFLADFSYERDNHEGILDNYGGVVSSHRAEEFIKYLAEIKKSLYDTSLGVGDAGNMYYFTSQIIEVLGELENFSKVKDVDKLKLKLLNLRDSVAAPKNIKSIAHELVRLYFFDYDLGFSE